MRRALWRGIALAITILASCSFDPGPPPPRYDHIVIVIEENHSAAQVMGSSYLSSLASGGASFSAMYGITHPSQPNYFALFSSFPSDHALLPTVSFVVPNLDHDMHDGTVAAGDAWLQANLGGYASWASSNHSLLVVTFDECAGSDPVDSTPIATILVGTSVRPGIAPQRVTLYSLLRMIEEMYRLSALGEEGTAPRITGVWE